jgi:uncharacterized membrane protein YphA (DoxX/SURF4 family)
MNNTLITVGRILFALMLAMFGIAHLMNASAMGGAISSYLASAAVPVIYFTGICLLAAAASFILNKWSYWAGLLLAFFLVLVVVLVHLPGLSNPDPMMAQNSMSMIMKDASMAGTALILAGLGKK